MGNPIYKLIVGLTLALSVTAYAQERIVWQDDFSGQPTGSGTNPTTDFAGGAPGADWKVSGEVNDDDLSINRQRVAVMSAGAPGPAMLMTDERIHPFEAPLATVPFSEFAPFSTFNNSDRQMKLRFDMRVDRFSIASSASIFAGITFSFSGSTFAAGFTRGNFDADPFGDLALFVSETSLVGGAVGLSGGVWAPGFDFGNYDSTASDLAYDSNDTFAVNASTPITEESFYRFELTLTNLSPINSLTVTRLDNGLTTADSVTRTFNRSVFAQSSDGLSFFTVRSPGDVVSEVYYDNFLVTVAPEPSSAVVCGGFIALLLSRRRRAM